MSIVFVFFQYFGKVPTTRKNSDKLGDEAYLNVVELTGLYAYILVRLGFSINKTYFRSTSYLFFRKNVITT